MVTQTVWLGLLLIPFFWLPPSVATLANPPTFFPSAPQSSAIPLRAPCHLSKPHLDHADLQRSLQTATLSRKPILLLSPRQNTQSSNNPHDELHSIAYLSGAYDLALNISSSPNSQLVFVQLDTGSSDLWITSTSCTSLRCHDGNVLKFNPAESESYRTIQVDAAAGTRLNLTASSFGGNSTNSSTTTVSDSRRLATRQSDQQKLEIPFSIYYDDTTAASGILASDTIALGNLVVPHQAFALINATNVTLAAQGISGVLGLGFPRGSVVSRSLIGYESQIGDVETMPFMTSVLQGSNESYPLFGLFLTRDGGRATFGAVDPQLLPTSHDRALVEWYDVYPFPSGDTWLPANDTLNVDAEALGPYVQWVLPLHSAGVAANPVTLTPTYSSANPHPLALIDSGSSSILGPASDVEAIFSRILNSRHVGGGRFVVPCDTTERMYFSFGGRNLTLLPSDYIIGPDAQQPFLCFAWPSAAPPDTTGVSWILGTPFLRTVYSLFSIGINTKESPKIGFFPLRQPASATESSIVFAPQPTQSLSSFLNSQATTIDSWIPNQLVTLTSAQSRPYFFANATTTPSLGVVPTKVGAPESYSAILTRGMGGQIPAIASSSSPQPVPHNPAATGDNGANNGQSNNRASLPIAAPAVAATICSIWVTLILISALMAV
ncbi:related to MKC7 - aspartyl protease of the periplasmic space [Ustilago trichophora]|uniref:Related to MKC7 - aspartyl protease of the periplasmic space n=1 Tax=Ustilago trichophora TaxID=86804 RepID=A0A5C3EAP8_9BASI|nr:related to MKC7 - aspartyl protease of the periplasmic space [Ustilago trichophora]